MTIAQNITTAAEQIKQGADLIRQALTALETANGITTSRDGYSSALWRELLEYDHNTQKIFDIERTLTNKAKLEIMAKYRDKLMAVTIYQQGYLNDQDIRSIEHDTIEHFEQIISANCDKYIAQHIKMIEENADKFKQGKAAVINCLEFCDIWNNLYFDTQWKYNPGLYNRVNVILTAVFGKDAEQITQSEWEQMLQDTQQEDLLYYDFSRLEISKKYTIKAYKNGKLLLTPVKK